MIAMLSGAVLREISQQQMHILSRYLNCIKIVNMYYIYRYM